MWFIGTVLLAVGLAAALAFIYLRLTLLSLRWPNGLVNKEIARRCRIYFAHHGIRTVSLSSFYSDVEIKTDNLEYPIGSFVFCCMDEQYFAGNLCFASMREEETIGLQGREVYKYPDILVFVTPSKVSKQFEATGALYGIPVLHTTDLRELALALSRAKTGSPLKYEGRSLLLQSIIESRLERARQIRSSLEAARRSEEMREWPDAEQHWRSFLSLVERPIYQPEARLGLATAVAAQGRSAESDELFRSAISDNPNYIWLAEGYAKAAYTRGDLREALSRWEKVINAFPERWYGYGGKIKTLFEIGDEEAALTLLRTESSLRRNNADAAHDLARWAERLGNWGEAEVAWRRFIRLNNTLPWAFTDLARALVKQGKFREANKILVGARKRFPDERDLMLSGNE
jgi:tetratricopeptide (TPR) repeat protein